MDGFFSSNFSAYSFGTGAEIGIESAPATTPPVGLVSVKTIVCGSGVVIPSSSVPGSTAVLAPLMLAK